MCYRGVYQVEEWIGVKRLGGRIVGWELGSNWDKKPN